MEDQTQDQGDAQVQSDAPPAHVNTGYDAAAQDKCPNTTYAGVPFSCDQKHLDSMLNDSASAAAIHVLAQLDWDYIRNGG